jgi:hypothetical protein
MGALIVGQQVMCMRPADGGPGVRSPDVGSPIAYRRWVCFDIVFDLGQARRVLKHTTLENGGNGCTDMSW